MNLKVSKILSNLKVHCVIHNHVIASNGSSIYNLHNKNFTQEKLNIIPNQNVKGFLSSNRLISRCLRLGIFQIKKLFDNLVIIFCNRKIILSNTDFSKFKLVDVPIRSFQLMDHSICVTGKYVYYGEYFPNKSRDNVQIYRSEDGSNWNKIFSFRRGSIKHIHVIQEDPYDNKIWFSTGDSDEESKLGFTDYDFSNITFVGMGDQTWRTLEFLFKKDKVYWGMDTPLKSSHLIEYDRRSKNIKKIGRFDGPIYNLKRTNLGIYLIGTAAEGGPGELDNKAHIWLSKDLKNWVDSISYAKDIYPYKMGLGRLLLPDRINNKIIYSGYSLKEIDKKLVICDVV